MADWGRPLSCGVSGALMPVDIHEFVRALTSYPAFHGVSADQLAQALQKPEIELSVDFVEASVKPLVRSGDPVEDLIFIRHGTVVPWQYPYSELEFPFLLGEHEVLLEPDQPQWVANYSAVTESLIVRIPVPVMRHVLDTLPEVGRNMELLVLRRLSRFYWTSLSTTGTPESKVAAALISRLASEGEDAGTGKNVTIQQKDLIRLTAASRAVVSQGVQTLFDRGVIDVEGLDRPRPYYSGEVRVAHVDRLKEEALAGVGREIDRLVRERS